MWIRKATNESILFIANHMRHADANEIFSTRWDEDRQRLTDEILVTPGLTWVLGKGDNAIMVFGAMPIHPGVWSVWMFATDDFTTIGIAATRYVKKMMAIVFGDDDTHRAECHTLHSHTVAHRWLRHLGFYRESVLKQYGKNKENFYKFVWRKT